MSKKLYLHIGFWKTGTTTIQENLFKNRKILAGEDICYPSISSNHTFLPSAFHPNPDKYIVAKSMGVFGADLKEWHSKSLLDFEKEIENFNTVIVSSEFLLDLPKPSIQKLKKYLSNFFTEIKVIVYLRYPIEHLASAINEQVKQGHYSLEKAYEIHSKGAEYIKLRSWINVFGKENFDIRSFDKSDLISADLLKDFFSITSINDKDFVRLDGNMNTSLSHAAVLIADKILTRHPSFSKKRGDTNYLYKIKGKSYKPPIEVQNEIVKNTKSQFLFFRKDLYSKMIACSKALSTNDDKEIWSDETIESIALLLHDNALKISTTLSENFLLKAQLAITNKKFLEANSYFEKSLEHGGGFVVYRDYALFLYQQSLYEKALMMCKKAILLEPTKKWPHDLEKLIISALGN